MGSNSESAPKPYRYFDTPDGQDLPLKLIAVMPTAICTGLALSTIDVMLHSHPKTYQGILGRYAYFTIPVMGMTAAFVVTTNLVCNYRGEDDKWNWAAGGMATGVVWGAWLKCPVSMWIGGGFFALVGVMKKYAVQSNYTIYPPHKPAHGGARAVRHDWTLTKDCPGLWKRE